MYVTLRTQYISWMRTYIKRRLLRFCFDYMRTSQLLQFVTTKATVNTSMMVYTLSILPTGARNAAVLGDDMDYYILSCGVFVLLVSTNWAMRRPSCGERATGWLHFFIMMHSTYITNLPAKGALQEHYLYSYL